MKMYFKVVFVFPMLFLLSSCVGSIKPITETNYPTPEKSDAPKQCKIPTKPLVLKLFYKGEVVLNSRIRIENANITFEKKNKTLEIEGVVQNPHSFLVVENGEEMRDISFSSSFTKPQNVKLLLKIDTINTEYLEKVTGQNLFVEISSSKEFVFYECVPHQKYYENI